MSAVGYRVLTIADIEQMYYGMWGRPEGLELQTFMKELGDVTTALRPGYFNIIYGAQVWYQLNREANIFAFLPKVTWPRAGWRVITAWGTTDVSKLAVSEGGPLPEPVRPSVRALFTTPKAIALQFEVSEVFEELAARGTDDVWGGTAQLKIHYGIEFVKMVNKMLGAKAVGGTAAEIPTIPQGFPTTIDQVVSSYSEVTGIYGTNPPAQVVQNINPYGLDRAGADSWANATVLHNNGTARPIEDKLILELIAETKKRGATPTDQGRIFLMGIKTWAALTALYQEFVRYLPISEEKVQTPIMSETYSPEGSNIGFRVQTLYRIPVVASEDVPADTPDGLERIYLLDAGDYEGLGAPRLGFAVLKPVEYLQTTPELMPAINKLVYKGLYRMLGDFVARHFPGQGKLRDLR